MRRTKCTVNLRDSCLDNVNTIAVKTNDVTFYVCSHEPGEKFRMVPLAFTSVSPTYHRRLQFFIEFRTIPLLIYSAFSISNGLYANSVTNTDKNEKIYKFYLDVDILFGFHLVC